MEKKHKLEKLFEKIHVALAEELLDRITSGEATPADLNAARQFLKDNDIYGIPADGTAIQSLMEQLPDNLDNVVDFRVS